MHPVVFYIFKFPIHSYGLLLAASFITGILFSGHLAKKRSLDPNVISDSGFWIIISAILGSRIYYVFLHFEEFQGNLLSIFNPFQEGSIGIGGLVMYGGFIGAVAAGFFYFKWKKLAFLPYADVISPSVGIGIFLTRIGCFLNGCCYGAPTESWCGVSFPISCPAGHYQLSVHAEALFPSQLFLSAGGLLIAAIVLLVGLKKTFTGFQFYLTIVLYAVLRFMVDFTRFYSDNERLGSLSHNQIVCIGLFIIFGGLILKNFLFKPEDIAAPEKM